MYRLKYHFNNSSDITYKDISDELNSIKREKSKSQTNSDDKQETNPEKR